MIKEFVDIFEEHKAELRQFFTEAHPNNYSVLVKTVISFLASHSDYDTVDPKRITEIDHGDYQGTIVYVIAAHGYQPSDYWYVTIYYGSCSGCDTLEAIRSYSWEDTSPTSQQTDEYMTLALHIVQKLKKMSDTDI